MSVMYEGMIVVWIVYVSVYLCFCLWFSLQLGIILELLISANQYNKENKQILK